MIRRPPRSTRTDTLFPYTTLFRSSQDNPVICAETGAMDLAIFGEAGSPVERWLPLCDPPQHEAGDRSEEHTSELQSLMRISYAVFCLKKKKKKIIHITNQLRQKNKIKKSEKTLH